MNHSLDDLAAQYDQTAELITQMIRHGNELLRKARAQGDSPHVHRLQIRQRDLYAQREHVLDIATHLKTYYNTVTTRIQ